MFSLLSIALISFGAYYIVNQISGLNRNIALAKASGLRYHVSPIRGMPNWFFIATEKLTHAILNAIPAIRDSKYPILATCHRSWTWRQRAFETLGENYLIVTSDQIYLNSSDPEGIQQLLNQRLVYVKPQELYAIVDIFGRSLISAEGDEWKRHRKVVAPAFQEKSNLLVWQESIRQANGLLRLWSRQAGNSMNEMFIKDACSNCANLALNVISGAGFGVSQVWEGDNEEVLGDSIIPGFNTTKMTKGHTLTFKHALHELVDGILWMMLLPRWILSRSPLELHKKVIRAHTECTAYFNELADYKIALMDRGNNVDARTMDLMAPMVKASQSPPDEAKGSYLTRKEVVADSWLLLFAGHETTANTLHYTLLYLGTILSTQKAVQDEIDSIVGDRPQSEWTYEKDMGLLYNSLVGACFSETLRMIPPVLQVPKTSGPRAQTLILKGTTHIIPANIMIHADGCGVGRNPKYWPHAPSKITDSPHDMNDFVPQRWFSHRDANINTHSKPTSTEETNPQGQNEIKEEENIDGLEKASFESTNHTTGIYVPPKGTFIAFAEGPRACPGRRFAQVEMTAVLTSLLKTHTIELDVSKYASDEEVQKMSRTERKTLYDRVARDVRREIDESISIIAVRLLKPVPLRVVRRGRERFLDCYV